MPNQKIETVSPIDNSVIVERQSLSSEDFPSILKSSTEAFKVWSQNYTLKDRKRIIAKFLELLENEAEKLGQEVTYQMGRPIKFTANEILTAVERGKYLLSICDEALSSIVIDAHQPLISNHKEIQVQRCILKAPKGPILVISAWNYPWLVSVNSLIPALLAGNSIILKPSPQTPLTAESSLRLLKEAGLPDGVLEIAHIGQVESILLLASQHEIEHVAFTGSLQGGRAIQLAVATICASPKSRHFVNVALELGGKDAAYVREDAKLEYTASQVAEGIISNSGQSCCSIERVYVHAKVYDQFKVLLKKEIIKQTVIGDPWNMKTTLGPVVSQYAATVINQQIDEAVFEGACKLLDESDFVRTDPDLKLNENYVFPQVLMDVSSDLHVARDESFGPIAILQRVESDEEALTLINSSEFGLTASLWTTSETSAEVQYLIENMEAGTIYVNGADFLDPALAWTGWKNSGRGVALSKFAFDQFYKLKSVYRRILPENTTNDQ